MITGGTSTAAVYKQCQPYTLYEGCKKMDWMLWTVDDFNFRRVNLDKNNCSTLWPKFMKPVQCVYITLSQRDFM